MWEMETAVLLALTKRNRLRIVEHVQLNPPYRNAGMSMSRASGRAPKFLTHLLKLLNSWFASLSFCTSLEIKLRIDSET